MEKINKVEDVMIKRFGKSSLCLSDSVANLSPLSRKANQ